MVTDKAQISRVILEGNTCRYGRERIFPPFVVSLKVKQNLSKQDSVS